MSHVPNIVLKMTVIKKAVLKKTTINQTMKEVDALKQT